MFLDDLLKGTRILENIYDRNRLSNRTNVYSTFQTINVIFLRKVLTSTKTMTFVQTGVASNRTYLSYLKSVSIFKYNASVKSPIEENNLIWQVNSPKSIEDSKYECDCNIALPPGQYGIHFETTKGIDFGEIETNLLDLIIDNRCFYWKIDKYDKEIDSCPAYTFEYYSLPAQLIEPKNIDQINELFGKWSHEQIVQVLDIWTKLNFDISNAILHFYSNEIQQFIDYFAEGIDPRVREYIYQLSDVSKETGDLIINKLKQLNKSAFQQLFNLLEFDEESVLLSTFANLPFKTAESLLLTGEWQQPNNNDEILNNLDFVENNARSSDLVFFDTLPVYIDDCLQLYSESPLVSGYDSKEGKVLLLNKKGELIATFCAILVNHSLERVYLYHLFCNENEKIDSTSFQQLDNRKFTLVFMTFKGFCRIDGIDVNIFPVISASKSSAKLAVNNGQCSLSVHLTTEQYQNRPQKRQYAVAPNSAQPDYTILNSIVPHLHIASSDYEIEDSVIFAVVSIGSNDTKNVIGCLIQDQMRVLFGSQAQKWMAENESRNKVIHDFSGWFHELNDLITLQDLDGNVLSIEKGVIVAEYIDYCAFAMVHQVKISGIPLEIVVNGKTLFKEKSYLQNHLPHIVFSGSRVSSQTTISETQLWSDYSRHSYKLHQIQEELQEWWNLSQDIAEERIRPMYELQLYEGFDIRLEDLVYMDTPNIDIDVERPVALVFPKSNQEGIDEAGLLAVFQGVYEDDNKQRLFLSAETSSMFTEHLRDSGTRHEFFLLVYGSNKWWRVPVRDVRLRTARLLEKTTLCMDFGTSYSTCGMFVFEEVENTKSSPLHAVYPNKYAQIQVIPKENNIVKFSSKSRSFFRENMDVMAPTMIAVVDCRLEQPKLLFGYEAERFANHHEFRSKATIFRGIKRWIHKLDVYEDLKDINGYVRKMSRRELLREYVMFMIREAEQQFKCRFRKLHLTSPVKLKQYFLDEFQKMFAGTNYQLEMKDSLDEGVAVLFNDILEYSNEVRKQLQTDVSRDNYISPEKKAMIIDCGGGTTDVAACTYHFDVDRVLGFELHVKTDFMNGDSNFGGNNLTYLLMQLAKIKLARTYDKGYREAMNQSLGYEQLQNAQLFEKLISPKSSMYKDVDQGHDLYHELVAWYEKAESIIPTRYDQYRQSADFERVKANFAFLWAMSEDVKKQFFHQSNLTNLGLFDRTHAVITQDVIEVFPLLIRTSPHSELTEIPFQPETKDIDFTIREIEWLYRPAIYKRMNLFLNDMYQDRTLQDFSSIRLTGQSTKIGLFSETLKEFVPGKSVIFNRENKSDRDTSDYLKLACLVGVLNFYKLKYGQSWGLQIKPSPIAVPFELHTKDVVSDNFVSIISKGKIALHPGRAILVEELKKGIYGLHTHRVRIDTVLSQSIEYMIVDSFGNKTTPFDISFAERPVLEILKDSEFANQLSTYHFPYVPDLKAVVEETRSAAHIFVAWNELYWGVSFLAVYKEDNRLLFRAPIHIPFEKDEDFFDGLK